MRQGRAWITIDPMIFKIVRECGISRVWKLLLNSFKEHCIPFEILSPNRLPLLLHRQPVMGREPITKALYAPALLTQYSGIIPSRPVVAPLLPRFTVLLAVRFSGERKA